MARKTDTRPDTLLRAIGAGGTRATVDRILSVWVRATPQDILSGASWYGDDAQAHLRALTAQAHAQGLTWWTDAHSASLLAHLSPRTTWARNVAGAYAMVAGGVAAARMAGCIGANVDRAFAVFSPDGDPLSTFGPNAHKTRAFARNLAGDRRAVTVDVWAARVAFGDTVADGEKALKRVGVYAATAHAYRLAAARVGVDPTTMQATTWVVARNGRAA